MGRSADYTIQGFLYQFNQTLSELLKADDDAEITIEGIVEDIEVRTFSGTKAIQCKYHETKETYTPSILYDPLLQMMKHYKSNPTANIDYHLFVHFPNSPKIIISATELNEAINSKNKELQNTIKDVIGVNISGFLTVFSIRLTSKYDDLMMENMELLSTLGFEKTEVEALFYPNAIQIIGDLSIKHEEALRKVTKKDFLATLRKIRSTAISQWTLALKTRKKIIESRRKQLKENLNKNVRLRFVTIFPEFIEQFDEQIILFIKSFIDKYHYKQAHTQTPLFALDVTQQELYKIASRLDSKDVCPNLGLTAMDFSEKNFFREPMANKDRKEFALRLISWNEYKGIQLQKKADDFFVIGYGNTAELDLQDINVENLACEKLEEVKYMLGISDVY
ncbi:hypothetical protein [Pseudomonas oryzihabitans]|uniref:hypothetical protein n=1 Tax=Pseudomonas oryzihabitans TaxID=47885 RepID=UPI0011225C9A|nr:hypothetical protein [Pseudomonas psychrotolerans]QDD89700.1 hypothetical protein CCZ28_11995 [Pseudomonas psychrotolerans]